MIGRLFWFAAGAGVAVWGVAKVKASLQQASPEAASQRVTASLGGLGDSARDFLDRVRAASAEREAELRSVLLEPGSDRALPRPPRSGINRGGASSDALGLPE